MNAARADKPPSKAKRKPTKPRYIWGLITLKPNSQLGSLFQEIITSWSEVFLVKVLCKDDAPTLVGDEAEYGYLAQRTVDTIKGGQKTILGTHGLALSDFVMNHKKVPVGLLVCCSVSTWAVLKTQDAQDLRLRTFLRMPRC